MSDINMHVRMQTTAGPFVCHVCHERVCIALVKIAIVWQGPLPMLMARPTEPLLNTPSATPDVAHLIVDWEMGTARALPRLRQQLASSSSRRNRRDGCCVDGFHRAVGRRAACGAACGCVDTAPVTHVVCPSSYCSTRISVNHAASPLRLAQPFNTSSDLHQHLGYTSHTQ